MCRPLFESSYIDFPPLWGSLEGTGYVAVAILIPPPRKPGEVRGYVALLSSRRYGDPEKAGVMEPLPLPM